MTQEITITNITKIGLSEYSVEFDSNFDLTDLFYEVSALGGSFSSPVATAGVSSPQTITVANSVNFNVRLSSNYTPTPPYSRIHTTTFTQPFN